MSRVQIDSPRKDLGAELDQLMTRRLDV